ncbi:MAG: endolytic transglycosylase MltG, partial [Parcubacteria group bacterium]|nr:endolytic transglycosylase MltG [Parcubacteria group bacterium]
RAMRENFFKKIKPLETAIGDSGKNLHEILTMASLLEEEARAADTRRLIAGILWRRLKIGMPLQVDATFMYINGKNTFELTLEDLADDSSPYNTYTHKGLPPGPITNPGLDSIVAALYPKENPYLFYLADLSGTTYYSRTFDEHKEKKFRYLP